MNEKDATPYVRWLGDPEVATIVGVDRVPAIKERVRQLEAFNRSPSDLVLGIEIKETSKLIGTIAYRDIDWNKGVAEVAIFIGDKREWNKGYGTEAMRIMLKIGFKELNLKKIKLHVRPSNQRARHVFHKLGFKEEKATKEYILMTIENPLKSERDKV
jgi:RimJ/RimL family protein N-acetyltransferase